jgi:hypothetical protein
MLWLRDERRGQKEEHQQKEKPSHDVTDVGYKVPEFPKVPVSGSDDSVRLAAEARDCEKEDQFCTILCLLSRAVGVGLLSDLS